MKWVLRLVGVLVVVCLALYAFLVIRPHPVSPVTSPKVPALRHVYVIMMENHSLDALSAAEAPYIHQLIARYNSDPTYYGVTHVSLPNYVALLSGSTHHTHSDNPSQQFSGPTLVSQMNAHHISWQGVMQSLPFTGYTGNWYPEPKNSNPTAMPKNALYAKKHDPFALFPTIAHASASHIVPLHVLTHELATGVVPRFVWITPNLCNDMHGQPAGSAACPSTDPRALVVDGNQFLAHMVPTIMHSAAWTPGSVIFITWDEAQMPSHLENLAQWKAWLSAGPEAPRVLGIPVGGGSVPFIAIPYQSSRPHHSAIWADHYNLLKTIEAGFGLPYLGHARSPRVQTLSPYLK